MLYFPSSFHFLVWREIMHKAFVNIDTDGGNNIVDHFHGKMTHRKCVIDCVIAYLLE